MNIGKVETQVSRYQFYRPTQSFANVLYGWSLSSIKKILLINGSKRSSSDPRFSLAARAGGDGLKRTFLFKSILGQRTKKDLFIQIDSKTMCIAVTGSGAAAPRQWRRLTCTLCRGCDENGPIPHDRLEIDCTVCSFLSLFKLAVHLPDQRSF